MADEAPYCAVTGGTGSILYRQSEAEPEPTTLGSAIISAAWIPD
jgi:hypothetical protein